MDNTSYGGNSTFGQPTQASTTALTIPNGSTGVQTLQNTQGDTSHYPQSQRDPIGHPMNFESLTNANGTHDIVDKVETITKGISEEKTRRQISSHYDTLNAWANSVEQHEGNDHLDRAARSAMISIRSIVRNNNHHGNYTRSLEDLTAATFPSHMNERGFVDDPTARALSRWMDEATRLRSQWVPDYVKCGLYTAASTVGGVIASLYNYACSNKESEYTTPRTIAQSSSPRSTSGSNNFDGWSEVDSPAARSTHKSAASSVLSRLRSRVLGKAASSAAHNPLGYLMI